MPSQLLRDRESSHGCSASWERGPPRRIHGLSAFPRSVAQGDWTTRARRGSPAPAASLDRRNPPNRGRPAVVQVRGRETRGQRRPGVLRLDAALHSIGTSTLRVEAARPSELTGGPRCWSHRRRHSKCMEGGVGAPSIWVTPHSRSPNCDRADFPRREPLAAVEPLGISPLSSCRWRAALGAGLPTPPLRWTAGAREVPRCSVSGSIASASSSTAVTGLIAANQVELGELFLQCLLGGRTGLRGNQQGRQRG